MLRGVGISNVIHRESGPLAIAAARPAGHIEKRVCNLQLYPCTEATAVAALTLAMGSYDYAH